MIQNCKHTSVEVKGCLHIYCFKKENWQRKGKISNDILNYLKFYFSEYAVQLYSFSLDTYFLPCIKPRIFNILLQLQLLWCSVNFYLMKKTHTVIKVNPPSKNIVLLFGQPVKVMVSISPPNYVIPSSILCSESVAFTLQISF